jgi:hypothetical protein
MSQVESMRMRMTMMEERQHKLKFMVGGARALYCADVVTTGITIVQSMQRNKVAVL